MFVIFDFTMWDLFLGNVLKEIVEPAGAIIYANKFELGDPTINALELWGAEYQENNAILCDEKDLDLLNKISLRERCPVLPVGIVTNNGKVNYTILYYNKLFLLKISQGWIFLYLLYTCVGTSDR